MKTVTGIVKFVNENEKSDNIVLDDNTRIYLRKGVGRQFFGAKGNSLSANVTEREFNGKIFLNANAEDITVELSGGQPAATKSFSKGASAPSVDARQESIVFQNSMAHATNIAIHNAGKGQVNVEDVLALAFKIAGTSICPKLSENLEDKPALKSNSVSADIF
jgi:hypothetical protein